MRIYIERYKLEGFKGRWVNDRHVVGGVYASGCYVCACAAPNVRNPILNPREKNDKLLIG